jgi:hypothetical protein
MAVTILADRGFCVHAKDMKEDWCLATNQAERARNHQSLRQALDDRTRVSRHLRHGDGRFANSDPQRRLS